jgi:hypothetical protein
MCRSSLGIFAHNRSDALILNCIPPRQSQIGNVSIVGTVVLSDGWAAGLDFNHCSGGLMNGTRSRDTAKL